MASLTPWLFAAWFAQALLLALAKPVGRGRQVTIMAVFGLLFLKGFDLLSHLFDCLEGFFESLLQGVVLLFEQLHLLLFDGSCLS